MMMTNNKNNTMLLKYIYKITHLLNSFPLETFTLSTPKDRCAEIMGNKEKVKINTHVKNVKSKINITEEVNITLIK